MQGLLEFGTTSLEAGARCKPRLDDAVMPILAFHGVVIHQVSLG